MVATHNRAHLLPELVAALEDQEGAGDFEAVIVDDRSEDDTPAVLERLAAGVSFPLIALRTSGNGGPARARNIGWRAARATLIAFTDDDCIPDRHWLRELRAALHDAEIAQGLTDADPAEAPARGPFARVLVIKEYTWKFETCNIGYRRAVLESIGGFDEQFPAPFGEDSDLGWRALESGAGAAWVPDAQVIHRVETTGSRLRDWVAWLRDTRRLEFAALMVRKHPRLRDHLASRWFYKPQDPPTLLALAGLALTAGRPRRRWSRRSGAALLLPWLCYRSILDPLPARRRWLWAVLPMTFIADFAAVAVLARGSIKYRTLLL